MDRVSCKDIVAYLPDGITTHYPVGFDNFQFSTFNSQLLKRVVLLDCGVKANIIRNLLKRNVVVIRVPWNYDFNHLEYDGLSFRTALAIPILAMLLSGISARHWMGTNRSVAFAWETSCLPKQAVLRSIN